MKSYTVNSTSIRHIWYKKKKKILIIEFMSGGVYEYQDVPHYMLKAFVKATSIGTFFADNIREHYWYRKIHDHSQKGKTISQPRRKHPSEAPRHRGDRRDYI